MCKSIIGALLATPLLATTSSFAVAQAPLTQSEIAALAQNPAVATAVSACGGDRWRLCGGVMPGGGRIVRCLAANAESLSPPCKTAMLEAWSAIAAQRRDVQAWPGK